MIAEFRENHEDYLSIKTDSSSEDTRYQARSNHMHSIPINIANPLTSYIGSITLPAQVAGCHDEIMMDDPIWVTDDA
ncbi:MULTISPECIES: hypothetical protein [Aeromonas]|uniref:hypothetical protein n=1 Tax=Aeromonas TaxID=642 RepID=UPI0029DE6024|nr:hypothetical protein [Aeromonas caviae]